mgnify:CR=1 FL=1
MKTKILLATMALVLTGGASVIIANNKTDDFRKNLENKVNTVQKSDLNYQNQSNNRLSNIEQQKVNLTGGVITGDLVLQGATSDLTMGGGFSKSRVMFFCQLAQLTLEKSLTGQSQLLIYPIRL